MFANHDRIAGLALMGLSGSAFLYAHQYFPDAPAMYPKLITGAMFLFSLLLFLRSFTGEFKDKDYGKFAIHFPRLLLAVFMTGAFFVGAQVLGFFTAAICFIPGMAYLAGYRSVRGLFLGTASYLIFVLVVFIWIFNRPLTPEWITKVMG